VDRIEELVMDVPNRPLKVTKAEAATRQVEAAIAALVRGDFDIAVTLAGAAEGMIERSGPHLFKFLLDHPKAEGVDKKKAWIPVLNLERDWLKHPGGADTLDITRDNAALMITRAASKLETWTPCIEQFKAWLMLNLAGRYEV
jgi:hypothetical protein